MHMSISHIYIMEDFLLCYCALRSIWIGDVVIAGPVKFRSGPTFGDNSGERSVGVQNTVHWRKFSIYMYVCIYVAICFSVYNYIPVGLITSGIILQLV